MSLPALALLFAVMRDHQNFASTEHAALFLMLLLAVRLLMLCTLRFA